MRTEIFIFIKHYEDIDVVRIEILAWSNYLRAI